ncbi:M13-type metalloendopeptidase [Rhodoluna sp.]|uniref:M13 family metallopeptidase n=1 Tax=Rhodoluna sp. TaxID=1969481 RepID=UPI003454B5EB
MSMQPGIDFASIDPNTRPQDDLFRHVNGKWLDETEIPSDKSMYGSFHMLADDSEAAVKEILLSASDNPAPGVSQQIGDLYASFIDENRANELGAAPIAADLKLINQVNNIGELVHLMGEFSRWGVGGLFGSYIDNDPGQPERYIVNFYQGGLGLPDEAYYREEKHAEIRDAYVPHITQQFINAGWAAADAEVAARHIMAFETALAAKHWNVVDSRDAEKVYNLYAFADLLNLSKSFDWNLWMAGAQLEPNILAESVVMMPSFFEGLDKLLVEENLESLKLWFAWQLINSSAPLLSNNFVNERFAFYGTKLSGAPEIRARWKRAVALVEGSLGEAIGEIYVDKYFGSAAKDSMDKLVEYLIEAYRESIQNLEWMSAETKTKALVKLEKFTPKIGYPKKWRDYSALEIRRDDLVGNVRRANEFEHNREVAKIGAPLDRDEWFMTPQTVNAYYNPGFNEIVFPAAILQPPFYSIDSDSAVNFGAIGAVIGHEIGHGFDDQGSKYDGDGALQSWWTDADRTAFEKRTRALIEQFNELTPKQLDDSHKVNGEFTIGENIGDLGGLGIAYKAWLISLQGQEATVVDGLTGAQRFFMSYAQTWRTKGRDEMMIQRLATDPHSPAEFRCNQIVRNIDAFYDAFDVQPSDDLWLDPADRVVIW